MSILLEDEREAAVRDEVPGVERTEYRATSKCDTGEMDADYGEVGDFHEGCVRIEAAICFDVRRVTYCWTSTTVFKPWLK